MAVTDCFFKVVTAKAGAIKGESTDPDFPSWIALSGWGWGLSSSGSSTGKGKSQGKSFDFTYAADSSGPAMFSTLATNDKIKTATMEIRRAGGASAQRYMKIELKNAKLTSLVIEQGDALLMPKIVGSMTFEEIEISYAAQSAQGGSGGGASTFRWIISDEQG